MPDAQNAQGLFQLGVALHQKGDIAGASAIYDRILAAAPAHFDALQLSGDIALQSGDSPRALALLDRALAAAPHDRARAPVHGSRAIALELLGRAQEARNDIEKAIAGGMSPVDVHFDRATALHGARRLEEAVAGYDDALRFNPGHIDALYRRGLALFELGQHASAGESFTRALARHPEFAAAHNGLGLTLSAQGRFTEALQSFDNAIRIEPAFASPYINRGIALRELNRREEALASLDRAVALAPASANAHGNRSTILTELKRPAEAYTALQRALDLNPDYPFLPGIRLHYKMYACDWTNIEPELAALVGRVARGEPASPPSPLLGLVDSPALQRKAAEIWMTSKHPESLALVTLPSYPRHARIRLGYYSADFHRHATAHLIAELFERHDREKFEVTAFSFGPATGDDMQKRLMAGCDRFIDVGNLADRDVAALSRQMEIDIAVDLKGLTEGYRVGIFAHRAAPVQINYLGYPGTMAAPYMDYIIADETLVTARNSPHFSERVVTLPHSYQVNDRQRRIADNTPGRIDVGLPPEGFVFCCFNNNFKITPGMFDIWMRILKAVEGSVLWLMEDNPAAAINLRKEAAARGIDPARLVFAGRIAPEDHLARHRLADLFLDTLPYNAHTTASDALWVGLPVLTCPGESFTARVAASLLNAVGLAEMIAPNLAEYEARAIALALGSEGLREVKRKLASGRATAPLFDTDLFTRDLETAYTRIFEDHHRKSL